MNSITIDKAVDQFPFLKNQQFEHTKYNPLEIELSEMDDKFLSQSLMENESEALGHAHIRQTLYVVRGDSLHPVDVKRTSEKIYPPEYLHPGMEFPSDEYGSSETIREALDRQDLTGIQYVVLHKRGIHGGWYPTETKPFNKLIIALIESK